MKLISFRIALLSASLLPAATAASEDTYLYPDTYEHGDGLGASVNEEALAKLIEDHTVFSVGEEGTPQVWHKIDLNNDGKAEIFLAPTQVESYHADWFDIFAEKGGQYEEIGSCANWFSLQESKNGYARILNYNNVGHRTDPTWKISIAAYDGTRYVAEHLSDLTSGQMEAKGIAAYRAKDYATAEVWFLNLLRSGLCSKIQAENNLALVLLREKRYQEVINRIENALATLSDSVGRSSFDVTIKHKANAHYNLGKAYEALKNLPVAWKQYHTACKLVPTDDRKATLKRLVEMGVDTADYEPIW